MRRTERLFRIIQILRVRRSAITGQALAEELEISLRTLYRDMAELMAQQVPVRGEAGTGYILEDGYDLPPLMLTEEELEAAALGAAFVAARGDPGLQRGARDLIAKLSTVIPAELRPLILDAGLRPVSFKPMPEECFDGAELRAALRDKRKLRLRYIDQAGQTSERTIWPLFIAYMEEVRIIVAWCETRRDYRHFRTERVQKLTCLDTPYPGARAALMQDWRALQTASDYHPGPPPDYIR